MPWEETCVMDERLRFVAAAQEKKESMAELCRRFGISRKTGYKLVDRYKEQGPVALLDRSRARHTHANAVPEAMVRIILAKREAWGPRKLRAALRRESPDTYWPASSTIGALIKEAGLVEKRRRCKPQAASRKPLCDFCIPTGFGRDGPYAPPPEQSPADVRQR